MEPYHILPLIGGVLYAICILFLKRSIQDGVPTSLIRILSNLLMFVFFLPFWLTAPIEFPRELLWQPLIPTGTFLFGQYFVFRALKSGDITIVTPLLGMKAVLVAVFTLTIIREPLPPSLWAGAALSAVAIALIQDRGSRRPGHRPWHTIGFAVLATSSFALTDVMVQKWAPPWPGNGFMMLMISLIALCSALEGWNARTLLIHMSGGQWKWILPGAGLFGLQAAVMGFALGRYGHATTFNILYNSRGIWTVIFVWLAGHYFQNDEGSLGTSVLLRRLAASILLIIAIALVLLG